MRYFAGPPLIVDYAKVCSRSFGAALILCCDWASAFGAEAVNKTTTDAGSHKSAIGQEPTFTLLWPSKNAVANYSSC